MAQESIVAPEGIRLRHFNDVDNLRSDILERIRSGYESKFPLENDRYRITLSNLKYPETNIDVRQEKDAILKNNSLSVPLFGKITLLDKTTKQVLDEQEAILARVPWLTHRGTYINGGNEYSLVAGQQRLKPGVYSRRKDNGELESHIATVAGTGQGMRIFMEPETGVYRIMVGKSRIPLYPVLKGIGVDDQEVEKWWGKDLLEMNKRGKEDTQSFSKFYTKMMGRNAKPDLTDKDKAVAVLEQLQRGEVDESVAERTLGFRQKNLNSTVLLRASQKLMNIQKGLEDEDDRDSLANKNFMGQEDLFEERISKDVGGLAKKLLSRSSYNKKLTGFYPGYFSPQLNGLVAGNSLSSHIDGINPLQILDFGNRVVQTGEGAIGDSDAIPLSSRALHPSQAMAIDPIKTPECHGKCSDVMTYDGWKRWEDITMADKLACNIDGKLEFHHPDRLIAERYVGKMYGADGGYLKYLVTPNHRMLVKPNGKLKDGVTPSFRFETPDVVATKTARLFPIAGHKPIEGGVTTFVLPEVDDHESIEIDMGDWLEFLGWYIAEGSFYKEKHKSYRVIVSQSKKANPDKFQLIDELLQKLPFTFRSGLLDFRANNKQLFKYLEHFGYCYDKFIPDYAFNAPVEARERFLGAFLLGDGRRDNKRDKDANCICTTSKRLADDFERFIFQLGYSTHRSFEPDERQPQYLGCHIVRIHHRKVRELKCRSPYHPEGQYYETDYDGMVYCATVPGGMLYTRYKNSGGFWSGNSGGVGVDQRFAVNAMKGSDKQVYFPLRNVKTGKLEYITPTQMSQKIVGFPKARRLMPEPPPVGAASMLTI
jgi:hypothetical protein